MVVMNNLLEETLKDQQLNKKLYSYHHEEWFSELAYLEVAFYARYIELYQNDPQKFLEKIANGKEQVNYIKQLLKLLHKTGFNHKGEIVQTFFSQVPINQIIEELFLMPQTFDYIIDKNTAQYVIGHINGEEISPFDETAIQDGKLTVTTEEGDFTFSIQSIILFLFMNATMIDADKKRILGFDCAYPEALFAYAYANSLQKENLESFNIKPKKYIVTSIQFASVVFSKALRFLQDSLLIEELQHNEEFIQETTTLINKLSTKKQLLFYECYLLHLETKVNKLEQKEKQYVGKQNELQKKHDKQKEKYEQEVKKVRQLKQELKEKATATTENKEVVKELKDDINSLKKQLKSAKDELKDEKKKHENELRNLTKKYQDELKENENLVINVRELQKQLTNEKRQKVQNEKLTFDKWLQKGKELIQGMSMQEEEKLKDFIVLAEDILKNQLARPLSELATNRIGYCKVNKDGHFINFGDNDWKKIHSIPPTVYLSNDQFVEVTKDYTFVQAFDYFYSEGPLDHTIAHFVVVEERLDEAYAKVNGKSTKIKYRENIHVNHNQVISINQQNEIVSYYQFRTITLDEMLPSIYLKGHEPLYIVMNLANGYVVRNLNEVERFIQLEEDMLPHSFIILDEAQNITYKDPSGQIFKRSNQYKRKLHASVSEIDEEIFVLKANQEYVQLHEVPKNIDLELGDMVWVDEFNRFIELVETEEYIPDETIEQKFLESGVKVTRKPTKPAIEKDKELLIIGNVRLSERYKQFFGELGYEVEVVDGTGPFGKIKQACTKHNTILYSTTFTSHKNSRLMKKEVAKAKDFILCHSTAPKIMQHVLEQNA